MDAFVFMKNCCRVDEYRKIGCTACKKGLTEVQDRQFAFIRERRKALETKPQLIREILKYGSEVAKAEGEQTLSKVKEAMDINYFDL